MGKCSVAAKSDITHTLALCSGIISFNTKIHGEFVEGNVSRDCAKKVSSFTARRTETLCLRYIISPLGEIIKS